jgi:hypothetical protein
VICGEQHDSLLAIELPLPSNPTRADWLATAKHAEQQTSDAADCDFVFHIFVMCDAA